ncbi:MAG: VWA domain-containing protein [Acidobacteria bacterium]|nr:VWA domain-containing protein [Acidobacteriota bacterium]
MNKFFVLLIISVLLCSIPAIIALDDVLQTKPKEAPEDQKIKVKTELMEVRAVVADRKGRIIENLKKEDFELLENDQPREISFFSISQVEGEQNRPAAADKAEQETAIKLSRPRMRLNEPPVRTTLFYVDNLHLSFASLNYVKQALRRFVNERLSDQDMVALASSSGTLGIAQQFTRDKQLLRYGIEQIRTGPAANKSYFTPDLAARVLSEGNDAGGGSVRREVMINPEGQEELITIQNDSLIRGNAIRMAVDIVRRENNIYCPCSAVRMFALNRARQVLSEGSYSRAATLMILRDFAEQMIRLPGKRMIVVFSDGFSMLDSQGGTRNDELQAAISRAVRSGVVIYSIDARGLTGPPTIDAGRNSSTGAYECPGESTVDPACLPPNPEMLASSVNNSEREQLNGLHAMAEETGGKMYTDTNNLGEALGQAFDANRYYYVLSYYLPADSDIGKFRSIKVRVRNHPEYIVRTARGFNPADLIVKREDEAGKTPQQRLLQAMKAPLPVTDLGVSAQADFLQTDSDDKQVTLTAFFDGDRFQYKEQDQRNTLKLEILYVIYDASGKQVDGISAGVEGKLTHERLSQAKTSGYRFARRLNMKPGVYQVRIGVREEGTDRMGTADTWVEVPELAPDKLEISDLILRNPLDTDPAVEEGVNVSELEQIRMVQSIPLYARDDFCDYFFRVYRGKLSAAGPELAWRRELLRDGKTIKQEQWEIISAEEMIPDGKGWFDIDGDVELIDFDPGVYELRVSVKDEKSGKTVQRSAVFSVE